MTDQKDQICLYCACIPGCTLLENAKGKFDPTKPITPDSADRCESWVPVRWLTREVRDRLYDKGGTGSLRGLYLLPELVATKLEKQEETYEMTDVVDFASVIKQGMTAAERREQLRYVTDDKGNVVLDEEGQPTPRNSHEYRFFAVSDDHHVGLDIDTGLFWHADQVLDYIVERETELGLIVGDEPKNTKAGTARETKMGKSVIRRGKAPATKDAKETKEPSKKAGRPRRSGAKAAAKGQEAEKTVDLSEIEGQVSALRAEVAALSEKLENLNGGDGEGEGSNDAYDIATNLHGIMHDYLVGIGNLVQEGVDVLDQVATEFNISADEGDEGDE